MSSTDVASSAPLSHEQRALWFLHELRSGTSAYNALSQCRLRGPLDVEALRGALEEVVRRHEILRAVFVAVEGVPHLQIRDFGRVELPVVDLAAIAASERAPRCDALAAELHEQPFDLSTGPVFRALIVRLAPHDHVLCFATHLSVADGDSIQILWRELASLYAAALAGERAALAPVAAQYGEYAVRQHARLAGDVLQRSLAYWKRQLAGAPDETALPFARARRADGAYRRARVPLELAGEPLQRLRELARDHDSSLPVVLIAALRVLLLRYTGQDDLCIGHPVSGRDRGAEATIGMFLNTVVLRTPIGADPSFIDMVAAERHSMIEARDHQDAPFASVVDVLGLARDQSRTPLFQVLYTHLTAPRSARIGELAIEPDTAALIAELDLDVAVCEHEHVLAIDFVYDAQLFDPAVAEQMARHYVRVLEHVAADPGSAMRRLSLLDRSERRSILDDPNAVRRDYRKQGLIHKLIETQVDRTPDAVAVRFEDQTLSYRELDARANQIAHHLIATGVAVDGPVGVLLERCLDMPAVLLGIWKAGAAFLPIDPTYPRERVQAILAAAGCGVIGHSAWQGLLAGTDVEATWLDLDVRIADMPTARPNVAVHGDQLAYFIFTSGSTGRPKGVMSTHAGAVNHLLYRQECYPILASDSVLQNSPFVFDPAVWELFQPLMMGATLVMARPEGHRDPVYLAELIRSRGITIAEVVPIMLAALLETADASLWTGFRRMFSGGEALMTSLATEFLVRSRTELVNVYGPTEASDTVTTWRCREGEDSVPIGTALANTRLHVLDELFEPVPFGVAGELYIGGVQLARGYLRRPDLTAERFVPDPHGDPGQRLYRTGDLARYRADGAIEFLGRIDHQVKVRGFRIELGEIERALVASPGVRQAVVVARDRGRNDKQLVAYLVASDGAPDGAQLRSALLQTLPEHMVPSAFIVLDALPMTPNGKIDRKALPAPSEDAYARDVYVAPRTRDEEVLARLWQEVLRVERVGVHDNFLALGGQSILGVQLVAKARNELDAELTLREFFAAPTVAGMAAALRRAPGGKRDRGSVRPLGLAEGLAAGLQPYFYALNRDNPTMGFPLVGPEVRRMVGPLDAEVLHRALDAVAIRHDLLRTVFVERDGKLHQVVRPPRPPFLPVFELVDWSARPSGEDRDRAIAESIRELTTRPFDLSTDSLVRVRLIRLAPDDHVLVGITHHIAYDGPSSAILQRDLSAAYRALLAERSAEPARVLDPLPFQFLDVTSYLLSYVDSDAGRAEFAFWERRFAGVPPLEVPIDFPRDEVDRICATKPRDVAFFPGSRVTLSADEQVAKLVGGAIRKEAIPPLVFLVAGIAVLLHEHSGQEDISIQTGLNMRPLLGGMEPLIGGFNAPVFVRVEMARCATYRDLFALVREEFSQAYDHALVPIRERVPAYARRINIGFYGAGQASPLQLGDAIARPFPFAVPIMTQFDLRPTAGLDDKSLVVELDYNEMLFRRTTVERLSRRFLEILQVMAEDPAAAIRRAAT